MATHEDEQAVLDVVRDIHEAWGKGDPDAFVADYAEDASATVPGSFMKSRQEIYGAMSFLFNGPMKGTSASEKVLAVRFITDDAAVVTTETGVLLPGESAAPPERIAFATWVVAKRDGKWQMAVYANCPSVGPGPQ